MKKSLLASVVILLLTIAALASTPTGPVTLKYATANADNSCPASGTANITNAYLDASGNYTYQWPGSLAPGAYCVYAHYNGDGSHQPSDATPVLHTVTGASTMTTVGVAPDPSSQGQAVTVSGSVQ